MRLFSLIFTLCLLLSVPLQAQEKPKLEMHDFARLPVLHDGRIKPLGSFARIMMREIAGTENPKGRPAKEILAQILFDPASSGDMPLLRLGSFDVKRQFGILEGNKIRKLFSLNEMAQPLNLSVPQYRQFKVMEPGALNKGQRDFIAVHDNAMQLLELMRSLSLILPLTVELPSKFNQQGAASALDGGIINYLGISSLQMPVADSLQDIIKAKGEDLEAYTDEEKKIALLSFQLDTIQRAAEGNALLKIIPGRWGAVNGAQDDWFAPWQSIEQGAGSPKGRDYLALWDQMAQAYRANDPALWERSVKAAAHVMDEDGVAAYSPFKFELEMLYNSVRPYDLARGLYLLAIICMCVYFVRSIAFTRSAALWSAGLAMSAHIFGITSRVLILDRPPVGTLYESVLFVALICVLSGFVAALWRRQDAALLAGSIAALGLLVLAPVILPQGESLEVLVAVLNTNFWLATHVTIITAGYGFCVLAACMAHFYLFARLKKPKSDPFTANLYKSVYKTSIVALLFTAVGTVLGGIWADQSWGRFWGWDPKENGALLIVLWLIWLQHGRMGGNLRDVPFMAGVAMLNIIVALAWFGVNLLNVGLHSYGFTNGIALGLGSFCALELIIIGGLWRAVRSHEKSRGQHAA